MTDVFWCAFISSTDRRCSATDPTGLTNWPNWPHRPTDPTDQPTWKYAKWQIMQSEKYYTFHRFGLCVDLHFSWFSQFLLQIVPHATREADLKRIDLIDNVNLDSCPLAIDQSLKVMNAIICWASVCIGEKTIGKVIHRKVINLRGGGGKEDHIGFQVGLVKGRKGCWLKKGQIEHKFWTFR